jgi:hypothetical protein
MELNIEQLQEKLREYEAAYIHNMGLANANYGAMEAIKELIARLQNPEKQPPAPTAKTAKE